MGSSMKVSLLQTAWKQPLALATSLVEVMDYLSELVQIHLHNSLISRLEDNITTNITAGEVERPRPRGRFMTGCHKCKDDLSHILTEYRCIDRVRHQPHQRALYYEEIVEPIGVLFGKVCYTLSPRQPTLLENRAVPKDASYPTGIVTGQPVEFATIGPHKVITTDYFKHIAGYLSNNPPTPGKAVIIEFFTASLTGNRPEIIFHAVATFFSHLRELKKKCPAIYVVLTPVLTPVKYMTQNEYNTAITELIELENTICLLGRKDHCLVVPMMALMHAVPIEFESTMYSRDVRHELEPLFNCDLTPTREYINRFGIVCSELQYSLMHVKAIVKKWESTGWKFPSQ